MERHNAVRDEIADWLRNEVKMHCETEQIIPEWGRTNPNTGLWEDARLDVVYHDDRGQRICMDVAIVDGSENAGNTKAAIPKRELSKHNRYPEANLFPIILDTRGKWGNEALAWTKTILKNADPEERPKLVRSLRIRISVALQRSVADQILCATKRMS